MSVGNISHDKTKQKHKVGESDEISGIMTLVRHVSQLSPSRKDVIAERTMPDHS